jgi:hypothetical protein
MLTRTTATLVRWCWHHRTKIAAVLLILSLLTPRPAQAQFGFISEAVIVAALNAINQALNNVIGGALRVMNDTLGSIRGIVDAVQNLFRNIVYPQIAIDRARGLVGAVTGIYNQIRAIAQTAVSSATLVSPRRLEQTLLSRDPLSIPSVTTDFQSVYQPLPPATEAAPEVRNVIDMSDAAAQAAMKRAIAIDAIAEQELRAAERMLQELQNAAPGTASMIGAQAAAWLVRSQAYTQAALADSMRLRAIELANEGAELKWNAGHASRTRQDAGTVLGRN